MRYYYGGQSRWIHLNLKKNQKNQELGKWQKLNNSFFLCKKKNTKQNKKYIEY